MWLLDVNLPNGLVLKEFAIQCDTTIARGWRDLGNGTLAKTAYEAGFRVILTRDRLFGESAGKALRSFPELSIIILRIPQSKETLFLASFRENWGENPIQPVRGSVIEWPR